MSPGAALLNEVWQGLGRAHSELAGVSAPSSPVPLSARTDVASLAWACVTAASTAAARLSGGSPLASDPARMALAYSSERFLQVDGVTPSAFAPLSGFFRTADGWVRTHGNYPHHAAALRAALGLHPDAGREDTCAALARRESADVVRAIAARRGLCVPVMPEDPATDAAWRARPLISLTPCGDTAPRPLDAADTRAPLRGVRVLDLTRVIAGPVGTRALALLGADVLRVDPPHLPEIAAQHLDTGHGKRSTLLDLAVASDRARFDSLLATADVVALGYRSAALDRLGLAPTALAAARPGVIVARHTAWGDPDQRGFDSLVQAACGIALIEGAPDAPGVLPAQALDHSTGYLLAAGVLTALQRRAEHGGAWLVETSLRRVAAELLGLERTAQPAPMASPDPGPHLETFTVAGHEVTTVGPALAYAGGPTAYAAPRPWGQDAPAWLPRD